MIAAEDAGRYRDGLGAMPPAGLPDAFLEPVPDALRGPGGPLRARPRPVPHRRGRPRATALAVGAALEPPLAALETRGHAGARRAPPRRLRPRVVRRRGACAACAARAWPRCGGRSSRPTRGPSGASCPTGSASTGPAAPAAPDALREVLAAAPGARPAGRPVGGRGASRGGSPTTARRASTSSPRAGEIVWVGAGAGGVGGGRVAIYFREDAPLLGPPPARPRARGRPVADALRAALAARRELLGRPARGGAGARARRSSPRSGRSSGPARSPTTSGCRCARPRRAAAAAPGPARARPPAALGGAGRGAPVGRRRALVAGRAGSSRDAPAAGRAPPRPGRAAGGAPRRR